MPRNLVRCSLVLLLSCAAIASAATSTAANPVVTFSTAGTKQVQLQACNTHGCTTITRTVTVLDPRPQVTSMNATPAAIGQGGAVHLSGAGTGAPPLTFRWRIRNSVGTQVATVTGAAVDWTAAVPPGLYSIFLDLSNASGTHTPPLPLSVTVVASPLIFADGFETGIGRWLVRP